MALLLTYKGIQMKWHEFKEQIDKDIEEMGGDKDNIDIEYIDVSYPTDGRIDVDVYGAHSISPNMCITSHS